MSIKEKTCPFCKGTDLATTSNGTDSYAIICDGCGADGPTGVDEKDAENKWRNRMPKITKSYCDICGTETTNDGTEMKFSTGRASKQTVEHTIKVDLKVSRQGPVNSVSEPVGQMPDDEICLKCYYNILYDALFKTKLPGAK